MPRASHLAAAGAWRRPAAAALTALAGALAVLAALGLPGVGPAAGDDFAMPFTGPFDRLLGFAGGVAVLALARGMARGRRRAADCGIAVLACLAVGRAIAGEGVGDVTVDLAAALALALSRDAFPVRRSAGGAARLPGLVALAAGAVAYVLHETAQIHHGRGTEVDRAVSLAAPVVRHAGQKLVQGAWWLAPDGALDVTLDVLVAVTLLAAALALRALLRPEPGSSGHGPWEHERAAALVARHGVDSLDPFALREDKSFHFAAGGFIAYRTVGETAVVAGDPVAPPGAAPAVLASFLRFAEARGWDVAVTGASERVVDAAGRLGLRSLPIGHEAIAVPADFTLDGRAIRKVRQSVSRVKRHGWQVELVRGDELTPELVAELGHLEEEWRRRQRRLQGFAMTLGRLWGAREDDHSLYALARAPDGTLRSFMRFASFQRGLSLDVMRRTGDEPNGVNEAVIVAVLEHARERGMPEVSLNFAGFAHVMAADAALSRGQRVLRWGLGRAHGRFQLERLVRFNAKFDPVWRPRYLLFQRRTRLPLTALRVLQAEAYVRAPRERPLKARWEPAPLGIAAAEAASRPASR
jgi:lysyl-tRNA synthetase class 2